MTRMPQLETARLLIRPFEIDDLDVIHSILDVQLRDANFGSEGAQSFEQRKRWLEWTVMSYDQLAWLYQPPYGDRAIVLKQTGALIGAIGYVPCLAPFGLLPAFASPVNETTKQLSIAELGLYYALAPAYRLHGYTSEAAAAMVEYAFQVMQLRRIVATTTYDNAGSMGVMRKLGMQIQRNPYPDPPWLQVVGVLENQPGGSA